MKKIESINITFENCESYNVPAELINSMYIKGFQENIYMHNGKGELSNYKRAYSFIITIKNDNNIKPYYDHSNSFSERVIEYNDICVITLNYIDNKKFTFYVPWDYADQQSNSYQKIRHNKDGSISIDIKRYNKK